MKCYYTPILRLSLKGDKNERITQLAIEFIEHVKAMSEKTGLSKLDTTKMVEMPKELAEYCDNYFRNKVELEFEII